MMGLTRNTTSSLIRGCNIHTDNLSLAGMSRTRTILLVVVLSAALGAVGGLLGARVGIHLVLSGRIASGDGTGETVKAISRAGHPTFYCRIVALRP
jgi:hypothetical protein